MYDISSSKSPNTQFAERILSRRRIDAWNIFSRFSLLFSFPYLCNKKVDIFTRNANKEKRSGNVGVATDERKSSHMLNIFTWSICILYSYGEYIQCLYMHIVNAYSQCIVNVYSGIIVSKKDDDNNMDGL